MILGFWLCYIEGGKNISGLQIEMVVPLDPTGCIDSDRLSLGIISSTPRATIKCFTMGICSGGTNWCID